MTVKSAFHIPIIALVCGLTLCGPLYGRKGFQHSSPPDLTKGQKRDTRQDWTLGPIGAKGWVFCRTTANGASRDARQILVSKVYDDGPAAGKLKVPDVIIGINGTPFTHDARRALAEAINDAEKTENKGQLKLLVWRLPELSNLEWNNLFSKYKEELAAKTCENLHGEADLSILGASAELKEALIDKNTMHRKQWSGIERSNSEIRAKKQAAGRAEGAILRSYLWQKGKVTEVVLTIAVLGTYSATAPYDCPKTEAIINQSCEYIKSGGVTVGEGPFSSLGLLSTGREDLMAMIKERAHKAGPPDLVLDVDKGGSKMSWGAGYKLVFLTEYYLATKDDYVLPAIKELACKSALGQSKMGTWSHIMAFKSRNGYWHGPLPAYGEINQPSITILIGLVLAEKCGIKDKELTQAIDKSRTYFEYNIGRGAINYGRHEPIPGGFENNGMSAAAAILFGLTGNQKGEEFFSTLNLGAAPGGREDGHQGCYWNHAWGGMGAVHGGKEAMIAFEKEMRWTYTLERDWKGGRMHQGNAGGNAGYGWDVTATRLLYLTAHKKNLYHTGKGAQIEKPLSGERIKEVLALGKLHLDKERLNNLSKGQILSLLQHDLPVARVLGAEALTKPDIVNVAELISMLESDNVYARYGACAALARGGKDRETIVAAFVKTLESTKDPDLINGIIGALLSSPRGVSKDFLLKPVTQPAIPALLKVWAKSSKIDPSGRLTEQLKEISRFISKDNIGDIDRSLLRPYIKGMLTSEVGGTRWMTSGLYPLLTDDDRKLLWPDIYRAAMNENEDLVGSGVDVRIRGLNVMAEHGMAEGLVVAKALLENKTVIGWANIGRFLPRILKPLKKYGASAKPLLPVLKALKDKNNLLKGSLLKLTEETISEIETGKAVPLKSIKDK